MSNFQQAADRDWMRMCASGDANLARYVYDETGQCRGRCTGHDRGEHHPLCRGAARLEERARDDSR